MRAALVFAVCALAACQTPCPSPSAEARLVNFTCEDGSALAVTFDGDTATVVQQGYVTLTLPSRISGAGYRYADNGAELRGRMSEARWTRPGAAETVCNEVRQ
jgi:hypothetical protein